MGDQRSALPVAAPPGQCTACVEHTREAEQYCRNVANIQQAGPWPWPSMEGLHGGCVHPGLSRRPTTLRLLDVRAELALMMRAYGIWVSKALSQLTSTSVCVCTTTLSRPITSRGRLLASFSCAAATKRSAFCTTPGCREPETLRGLIAQTLEQRNRLSNKCRKHQDILACQALAIHRRRRVPKCLHQVASNRCTVSTPPPNS